MVTRTRSRGARYDRAPTPGPTTCAECAGRAGHGASDGSAYWAMASIVPVKTKFLFAVARDVQRNHHSAIRAHR